MTYPLVLDLAADDIPVAVTCRVLGFSKQAFYRWRKDPVSQRDWDDAHLINAALGIHADDPEFGYRFIADELSDLGHEAGENRVARLCSLQGIFSCFAKKPGLTHRPGPPVHDDLVARDFTASRPNQLWLTDISEHRTDEGKLYICAVKDVWSNRIVGYSIDERMTASLAVAALRNAIALRSPVDTIVHSDRGSQFRSRKFCKLLSNNGLQDGPGGRMRRQRCHGIVVCAAATQRSRQKALGHKRRTPAGHGRLDRTHLPSTPPPTGPRTHDPDRI